MAKYKVMLSPRLLGMESLGEDIYIDSEMDDRQRRVLLAEIAAAKQKTAAVWGSITTQPEIYACSTEACFQSFGGSTNRANAIGNRAMILSPRALNSALISHEWSHTELYQRVDGFFNWRRIPNWFDEGIAVLVSQEATHGEEVWLRLHREGITPPELTELTTHQQWIAAVKKYRNPAINPNNLAVVYATAGHAVRGWYRVAGQSGLLDVIQAVKNGSLFEVAYDHAIAKQ